MRNKMTDTMNAMELIHADNLTPPQLMPEDLVKIGEDILEVISIESDSTGDIYFVQTKNEFGEQETAELNYNESIPLYVFIEEDE
jgi:hypothetical protein